MSSIHESLPINFPKAKAQKSHVTLFASIRLGFQDIVIKSKAIEFADLSSLFIEVILEKYSWHRISNWM